MRKVAYFLVGIVVVLVLVVALGPRLIGLNSLKPRLSEAVKTATGYDLTIAGDIDLAILPGVSFALSDVTVSGSSKFAQVSSIEGEVALMPLISGEIVVERLVVDEPMIDLTVNDQGDANWTATSGADSSTTETGPTDAEEPPQIVLQDVRIEDGSFRYADAASGQTIAAEDLGLALALPGMDQELTLRGGTTLNGQQVNLDLSLDSPAALQSGDPAEIAVKIASALASLDYQGSLQQVPVPSLAGTLGLDVTSVAEAAAWLGRPLDPSQPDPGALSLAAQFSTDQSTTALESAEIKGDDLTISASGSFDGSGEVKQAVLRVESGPLDVDRYLPAPQPVATGQDDATTAPTSDDGSGPQNLLELIPDEPFDVSALRGLNADVSLALDGIKAAGYQVGPINLKGLLKDGILNAQLEEIALYGGVLRGQVKVDATGDALDAETNLSLEQVDVGALAAVGTDPDATAAPPVGGTLSGTLRAAGQGNSPRALAETLQARLDVDLGGVELDDPAAADLSELKLAIEIPNLDTASRLTGTLVYKEKPVSLVVEAGALRPVLAGETFDLTAELVSALVTAGYAGQVQQQPLPGLDGSLSLDIGSVGDLAAWLGQALDPAQPDPGPLKVAANFSADQGKVVLERAEIAGDSLSARASGAYDGTGDRPKIALDLKSGALDIDRYLPPPGPASTSDSATTEEPATEDAESGGLLAQLSDDPIDLSALQGTDADISIDLAGIKAAGYELGRVALGAVLSSGVLEANLEELALYDGKVAGTVQLDSSANTLAAKADLTVDGVDVGALAAVGGGPAPVGGKASGQVTAAATGQSPRALAESLSAKLALDLGGLDLADAGAADLSNLKANLDLPGLDAPSRLDASAVYKQEPVTVAVDVAPLGTILAGEAFELKAEVASALVTAGYEGRVQQQPLLGLDGGLSVDIGSVGNLAAWLGQPLDPTQPDPGPFKLTADFAADQGKVALTQAEIEGEALSASATGSVDISGDVMKLVLDLNAGVLDIDRYLPPPAPMSEDSATSPAASSEPGEAASRDILAGLPDDPIDLSALRGTEADITLSVEGLKAAGYELGRSLLVLALKDGVLDTDLRELSLYGGKLQGTAKLDGAGEALGVTTDLTLDKVDVGRLATAATGDAGMIGGIASGRLAASATGASPRALAEALRANLSLDLGGLDLSDPAAADLSGLKLALDLPGIDAPSKLDASVVYKAQQIDLDLGLAPLKQILAGEPFALDAQIASALLNAGYAGKVQMEPSPEMDGALELEIGSIGELAAWLGIALDPSQPDPGPLDLKLNFAGDQGKVTLENSRIESKALDATVNGSFDASGDVPKIILEIDGGVLDLDSLMPAPPPPGDGAARDDKAGTGDPTAGLSDAPIDLSALGLADLDLKLSLAGLKAMGLSLGKIDLDSRLAGRVLDAQVNRLDLPSGTVTARTRLDASGNVPGLGAEIGLYDIDLGALGEMAGDGPAPAQGQLNGTVSARAEGASPKALGQALKAQLDLQLKGLSLAAAPDAGVSDLAVKADLPGLSAPSRVSVAGRYKDEPLQADLALDPIDKILAGETFALTAQIASEIIKASYEGQVQQQPLPGLDGALSVEVASVGRLAAWLDAPLDSPDPGPLSVKANFAAEEGSVALESASLTGKAANARASGRFSTSGNFTRFDGTVIVDDLDLDAYLPPAESGQGGGQQAGGQQGQQGWDTAPLDLQALRNAEGNVQVQVASARYRGLDLRDGRISLDLKGGVMNARIENLGMADGSLQAAATLDATGKAAGLSYRAVIQDVQARPVLRAFADSGRLSGRLQFETAGQAVGASQRQLVETLNGNGKFAFLDGAIHGINIAAALRQAGSLGFAGGEDKKTDFSELSGSFTITNGLLNNQDLLMLAPLVRLSGAGNVPMPPQTVDYRAEAKLVASLEGQGGDQSLAGLPIPISITGPWSNPSYGVDWQAVFLQAAADPSRIANMPDALKDVAKGVGVDLPIPGLGGEGGGDIGKVLESVLPGIGGQQGGGQQESGQATEGGTSEAAKKDPAQEAIGGLLNQVLKGQEPAGDKGAGEEPKAPDAGKLLKNLFSN